MSQEKSPVPSLLLEAAASLDDAGREIRRLRSENQILGVQVETMDKLVMIAQMSPPNRGMAHSPDIVHSMESTARKLRAQLTTPKPPEVRA